MKEFKPTSDQQSVLDSQQSFIVVSASAGTGKTATLIEYIANLLEKGQQVDRLLVVTFTNNSAAEMKERLLEKLMSKPQTPEILEQIDDLNVADISTIHSFLQKIIKRNIYKLNINEDYVLIEGNKSEELKNRAFDSAYNLSLADPKFEELLLSMKKEGELLKQITFSLENFFAIQEDSFAKLNYLKTHQDEIFENAKEFLLKRFFEEVDKEKHYLHISSSKISANDKNSAYLENAKAEMDKFSKNLSISENIKILNSLDFGRIGSLKSAPEELIKFRENHAAFLKTFSYPLDEKSWQVNHLIVKFYEFYELYIAALNQIKQEENALDFNDLETLALKVLEDENITSELRESYDYVFIDEYQDTNPVQEKILKKICSSLHFFAVGDPKQGIYGFRNATSEIMKKDILNAEKEDGNYYLKTNFRSDEKILNFVNKVFSGIMTDKVAGISYKETSMLEGKGEYKETGLPSVRIDVLKKEETEKKTEKGGVYDVFADSLFIPGGHKKEAKLIAQRVLEMVKEKKYDPSEKAFKPINYYDIVILVRGKGELSNAIIKEFATRDIPLVSTIDDDISSSAEVEVVQNYLSLAVDILDEPKLASVLCSKLGECSLDKLALARKDKQKSFYDEIKKTSFFKKFKKRLEKFKLEVLSVGASKALLNLFTEKEYYLYLLSNNDGFSQKQKVEKLLTIIGSSDYNYDLPALVKMLSSKQIKANVSAVKVDAVTLSTIHSTKGLEFPVVILAGMGKELAKKDARKNEYKYIITNEFGLAVINLLNDQKSQNIVYFAGDLLKKRKEFVDEMMLLYVAMTRAKNNLQIVGTLSKSDVLAIENDYEVFSKKSFMEIILASLKSSFPALFDEEIHDGVLLKFDEEIEEKNNYKNLISSSDADLTKKIKDYFNFNYEYFDATKSRYKESVTSLNNPSQQFEGNQENIEIGNAYHRALKQCDYFKINSLEDVYNLISNVEGGNLIDAELLFSNINLIKNKINNQKIYKEKQFTMKINRLLDNKEEEIMVQGVVDLFLLGEKNILIDFKYSNILNENKLVEKYKTQLSLYKSAIENAFSVKVDEVYLLSLKNTKLIKIKLN